MSNKYVVAYIPYLTQSAINPQVMLGSITTVIVMSVRNIESPISTAVA